MRYCPGQGGRCRNLVDRGRCPDCSKASERTRRDTSPWRKLYFTTRWQTLRTQQLRAHPLCSDCLALGVVTRATDVHHLEPHRGDEELFWTSPLGSLCHRCHSRRTGRGE